MRRALPFLVCALAIALAGCSQPNPKYATPQEAALFRLARERPMATRCMGSAEPYSTEHGCGPASSASTVRFRNEVGPLLDLLAIDVRFDETRFLGNDQRLFAERAFPFGAFSAKEGPHEFRISIAAAGHAKLALDHDLYAVNSEHSTTPGKQLTVVLYLKSDVPMHAALMVRYEESPIDVAPDASATE